MCYACFQYGHERDVCPNKKKGDLDSLVLNVVFLVDSGATHHVVPEESWLDNYRDGRLIDCTID